jgi:hypothetical protein
MPFSGIKLRKSIMKMLLFFYPSKKIFIYLVCVVESHEFQE